MQEFNSAEQALIDAWEAHTAAEFLSKDADAAITTMTSNPVLIHVPVERAQPVVNPCASFIVKYSFRRCRRTPSFSS